MATSVGEALLGFHERLLLGHLMLQMVLVVGHLRLRVAVEGAGRGRHRLGHGHRLGRLGLIRSAELSLLLGRKLIRIRRDFAQIVRPGTVSLRSGDVNVGDRGVHVGIRLGLNLNALMLDLVQQRRALIPQVRRQIFG